MATLDCALVAIASKSEDRVTMVRHVVACERAGLLGRGHDVTSIMMKSLTFFLIVVSCLMLQCNKSADRGHALAPEDATSVNELPEMNLVTMDQQVIRARELAGKNILVFFRTECDHCQREAEAISKNLDAFSEYQIYFVGTDGHEASRKFANDYALDGKDNVHFVQTSVNEILDRLGPISTPSLYIYSDERRLVRHLDGETPIQDILRYL